MPNKIRITLEEHMGDDMTPVRAARDSYGKTSDWLPDGTMKEGDQRLLRYLVRGMKEYDFDRLVDDVIDASRGGGDDEVERLLWKFRRTASHLAPFGHCYARFRFQVPVFVMRQLVKHEYIRFSELSMRYVRDMPAYFQPSSWRAIAEDVKQGSAGDLPEEVSEYLSLNLDGDHVEDTLWLERLRYDCKLCPEQARMFLRLCHMTQGVFSGSMDALAKLVVLRLDPTAQEETRQVARQIDRQLSEAWKISWPILTEGVVR